MFWWFYSFRTKIKISTGNYFELRIGNCISVCNSQFEGFVYGIWSCVIYFKCHFFLPINPLKWLSPAAKIPNFIEVPEDVISWDKSLRMERVNSCISNFLGSTSDSILRQSKPRGKGGKVPQVSGEPDLNISVSGL